MTAWEVKSAHLDSAEFSLLTAHLKVPVLTVRSAKTVSAFPVRKPSSVGRMRSVKMVVASMGRVCRMRRCAKGMVIVQQAPTAKMVNVSPRMGVCLMSTVVMGNAALMAPAFNFPAAARAMRNGPNADCVNGACVERPLRGLSAGHM